MTWVRTYKCTADFLPFRAWLIEAESPCAARLTLAQMLGYPTNKQTLKFNVDTTKTITHLGLCAGYGGIELGLKRVLPALRTVALCEIEAFACANLVAKMEAGLMDPAPIWTDLKTFPWAEFRDRVDILTGGYPCQPFSSAGKRLGTDDPRHLWPYIASGIRILKPRVCFFENVEGHISLGLREVIAELESLGYEATFGIFSAAECGASHQRKRVFILAYDQSLRVQRRWPNWIKVAQSYVGQALPVCSSDSRGELADSHNERSRESRVVRQGADGQQPIGNGESRRDVWPSRPGQPQHYWEPPRVVGNAESWMSRQSGTGDWRESFRGAGETAESVGNALRDRSEQCCGNASESSKNGEDNGISTQANKHSIGQTKPTLGGDVNGPASGLDYAELCSACDNRTDELRLLGNGVVPATAEKAFRTLWQELNTELNTK
jgi:DNA (cytosine-5)-methyltransferase 1